MAPMECVAVDWSGALTGAASRIWMATAAAGALTGLIAPGSREAVQEALLHRLRDARPVIVGLDFGFSLPAWYFAEQGWSDVRELWSAAREQGETWLRECWPPFWGRPGRPRPHETSAGLRQTEQRWAASLQPKSVFQIGGAGSVGTGSIRGMPMLRVLQDAGWAVWPFNAFGSHTVVEVYPRWFTGPVAKRREDARASYLRTHFRQLPSAFREQMVASEDAFDAGVTACRMSLAISGSPPQDISDRSAQLEGAIWAPDSACWA
jgi:hypothetical protein